MKNEREQVLKAARLVMGACSALLLNEKSAFRKKMEGSFSADEIHRIAFWMTVFLSWQSRETTEELLKEISNEANGKYFDSLRIVSEDGIEGELEKWMDHREQLIALHLGLYLKGEQHREFGPSIQKVLDEFHVKEAVEKYKSEP